MIGAKSSGHDVRTLNLHELKFDPILHQSFSGQQTLEPDLQKAQELILWSQHMVWVYPNWWGTLPANLKGFIDRTFLPGFAFKYKSGGGFPEKLLVGRTAEIILSMDTPTWAYRLFLGAHGLKIMKNSILAFCGIKVTKTHLIGPIRGSTEQKRNIWLQHIHNAGI